MSIDSLAYSIIMFTIIVNLYFMCEFLYSLYKKDGKYEPVHTIHNIINCHYIIVIFARIMSPLIIFLALFLYNALFHKSINSNYTIIGFIITLLCADLFFYTMHRLHHTLKILWNFHSVHHDSNI